MRKYIPLLLLLFCPAYAHAQGTQVVSGPTNPATCNPKVGQLFFNNSTSPGIMYTCSATNTWAVSGGSGLQSVAALPATCTPGVTANVYLNTASIGFPVSQYGCVSTNLWDILGPTAFSNSTTIDLANSAYAGGVLPGQIIEDATWTNTSQTVTSTAQGNWCNGSSVACTATTVNPVGWTVFGLGSCASQANFTQIPTVPEGTVTSVNSVHSIQVSVAATANTPGGSGTGCLIAGPLNDTAISAADTAAAALIDCAAIIVPVGNYLIEQSHFTTKNASCDGTKVEAQGGPAILGFGRDVSRFVLTPNFNMASCTAGGSSNVCFGSLIGMIWKDFGIFGGYNTRLGSTSNKVLVQFNTASLVDQIVLSGFGSADANLICEEIVGGEIISKGVVHNGCGSIAVHVSLSGTSVISTEVGGVYYGSGINQLKIESNVSKFTSIGGRYGGGPAGGNGLILNNGLFYSIAEVMDSADPGALSTRGYQAGATGIAHVENARWDMSVNSGGIAVALAGQMFAKDSFFKGSAAGGGFDVDNVSGTFFDMGGNSYGNANNTGIAPTCATTGLTQTGCAPILGSTNEKGTLRVTAGGVGGAFTETLTFAGTFAGADNTTPSCTFMYANTGTGAWTAPALLTISSRSTAAVVIAGTATTVAASTYDMDYYCVAK